MKSLITAVASMTILIMFMMQFVANERTFIRVYAVNDIIDSYLYEWKEEGEIKNESEKEFISKVSDTLGETVRVETIDRSNEENGEYRINIKIEDVIGPEKLLKGSIKNEANASRIIHIEPVDRGIEATTGDFVGEETENTGD